MRIVLIAAVAENGVIGRDNRLLWRLKSDMKHFRALTMGKPVIMGRKTFESIGKPLPGRHILVLTRDPSFSAEGVAVVATPERALEAAQAVLAREGGEEIMIAGGGEIYALFLPRAERLEITQVDLSPEGDAYFPAISPAEWRLKSETKHPKSADDEASFAFRTYLRR